MGRHKKSSVPCPHCNTGRVYPPLDRCENCFADAAVVMSALVDILQHHGPLEVLAAKPVLEKAVKDGWKDEYLDEFQVNLIALNEKYNQEDQQAAEFYNLMAEAQ